MSRVADLYLRWQEGDLDAAGLEELKGLLADIAGRRELLDHLWLDGVLVESRLSCGDAAGAAYDGPAPGGSSASSTMPARASSPCACPQTDTTCRASAPAPSAPRPTSGRIAVPGSNSGSFLPVRAAARTKPWSGRPLRWAVWGSVAAAVVMAALVALFFRPAPRTPEIAVAASAAPGVRILRAGRDLPCPSGASLRSGDLLSVPAGSGAILAQRDGTLLEVAEESLLRGDDASPAQREPAAGDRLPGDRFHLERGWLRARVSPKSSPAVFTTPGLEVLVKGTDFTLLATAQESLVRLREGAVDLRRLRDNARLRLKAGAEARADAAADFSAAPAAPQETGACSGRVVSVPTPGWLDFQADDGRRLLLAAARVRVEDRWPADPALARALAGLRPGERARISYERAALYTLCSLEVLRP